ncbi:L,D-transpeptidase family protein [Sporichthya sp.]|uniref:L,D-transpeptidase family protein n=1 Tax=Sporichthya sp. TaxID=65475 RepID=UPI0025D9094D|nr:L,D-transpeptidase family protein [Sporichthya sp.]
MQRRHVTLSALALTWALAVATPASADVIPPLADPNQPRPSEVSSVEGPRDAKPGTGVPVLTVNDRGRAVRVLQVRLQRVGVRDIPTSGLYGQETVAQVKAFQRLAGFARTGSVDQATLTELENRTGEVDRLDLAAGADQPYGRRLPASCLHGHVMCVDKRARAVRWVIDGVVKTKLDARFGSDETPTREGVFAITRKSRDHVSTLYDTSMPFALFFDRGQAVHYSPDFAARGYSGASHGCVNIRDYTAMRSLFDKAQVGDRVVVYRSKSAKRLKPAGPAAAQSAPTAPPA